MRKSDFGSAALIFALSFVLAGCSGGQGDPTSGARNRTTGDTPRSATVRREYPQSVADEFVKSCEAAGSSHEFCTCVFLKVQERYTFEEFSVIESKLAAKQPPEEFVEFTGKSRAACYK